MRWETVSWSLDLGHKLQLCLPCAVCFWASPGPLWAQSPSSTPVHGGRLNRMMPKHHPLHRTTPAPSSIMRKLKEEIWKEASPPADPHHQTQEGRGWLRHPPDPKAESIPRRSTLTAVLLAWTRPSSLHTTHSLGGRVGFLY